MPKPILFYVASIDPQKEGVIIDGMGKSVPFKRGQAGIISIKSNSNLFADSGIVGKWIVNGTWPQELKSDGTASGIEY